MRKHEEGLGGIHEVAKCCIYSQGAVDDGRTIILLDLGLTLQSSFAYSLVRLSRTLE